MTAVTGIFIPIRYHGADEWGDLLSMLCFFRPVVAGLIPYTEGRVFKMTNTVKEFFEVFGSLAVVAVLAAAVHFLS